MALLIHKAANPKTGLSSWVLGGKNGYHVILRDGARTIETTIYRYNPDAKNKAISKCDRVLL